MAIREERRVLYTREMNRLTLGQPIWYQRYQNGKQTEHRGRLVRKCPDTLKVVIQLDGETRKRTVSPISVLECPMQESLHRAAHRLEQVLT